VSDRNDKETEYLIIILFYEWYLLVFVKKNFYRHSINFTAADAIYRSRGSTFAYTQDNHTSVLGMRELMPMANPLCLTRNEAHEALDKMPSADSFHSTSSRNSLFAYPAQSNFSGTKYPLKWIETCRNGALDLYTGNRVKSR